jgi:hypothetical protein
MRSPGENSCRLREACKPQTIDRFWELGGSHRKLSGLSRVQQHGLHVFPPEKQEGMALISLCVGELPTNGGHVRLCKKVGDERG